MSLSPFLAKHGVTILDFDMYDTNSFFKSMERVRLNMFDTMIIIKTKTELMVDIYGTPSVKERYRAGKHSAVVDAWALAHMLTLEQFSVDFKIWLRSRVKSL